MTECFNEEIRLLSLDPGFTNLGWSVVSWRGPALVSVLKYSVFEFCPLKPSASILQESLSRFYEQVLKAYSPLYDYVVLETQPYVNSQGYEERLLNFNLQRMDMGLRGLVLGMGKRLLCVDPKTVRSCLGTLTGRYASNKKASVDFCADRGFHFDEVEPDKRNHVADSVCNAHYVLSKVFLKDDSLGKHVKPYRPPGKRRKKYTPLARDYSPPSPDSGTGTSSSENDDSPRQQIRQ